MNSAKRLSQGLFGHARKALSRLSDEELHDEVVRRRRSRTPADNQTAGVRPSLNRVRRYFANLELDPGAGLQEVERAYRRLLEQYHPDKHRHDPDKHRAANELSESLTHAYRAAKQYLERQS